MGLTTTFVFTRQGAAWRGVDDWSVDVVTAPEERPLLAAHVEDSDWCVVLGRDPDGHEWSWVYGEHAALGFDRAHRWLSELDPDDLDDSLEDRAAETAVEVVAWAKACGLADLDVDAVTEVLLDHDVFAETGWRRLLAVVGLDEVAVEVVEDTRWVPILDRAPRPAPPPRAIALDHDHPGWRRLDAGDLMGRFGEPPCLLQWRRSLYLATDPPLHLFHCEESVLADVTGATGEWITVPEGAAGSLVTAAAWARAHVGVAGAPAPPDRPPLLFEVFDREQDAQRPRHRRAQEWQLYEFAPPVSAALVVAWEDAGPELAAEAIAEVHDVVIGRVVQAFTHQGRGIHYGELAEPSAWDLQVAGWVLRTGGRHGATTASSSAWSRLVTKVRRGDVAELAVAATRTNAFGATWPGHATACVNHRLQLVDDPEKADLDDEKPSGMSLPGAPWLGLGVDAEFAAVLPVASLVTLLDRLVERLPVHRAWLHVGRLPAGPVPWLLVQPVGDPWDEAAYPMADLRGGLRWLRAQAEPPEFEARIN